MAYISDGSGKPVINHLLKLVQPSKQEALGAFRLAVKHYILDLMTDGSDNPNPANPATWVNPRAITQADLTDITDGALVDLVTHEPWNPDYLIDAGDGLFLENPSARPLNFKLYGLSLATARNILLEEFRKVAPTVTYTDTSLETRKDDVLNDGIPAEDVTFPNVEER